MFPHQLMADVNVLIIGSSRDLGETRHAGVPWNARKAAYSQSLNLFSITEVRMQLENIPESSFRSRIHKESPALMPMNDKAKWEGGSAI